MSHKEISDKYQELINKFADNLRNSPNQTNEEVKETREDLDRFLYSIFAKAAQ